MAVLNLGHVQPKQALMLRARQKYVGYGGARGGGKSHAARLKAKLLCARWAGIHILIVRRSLPEVRSNHIDVLRRELGQVARYSAQEKRFYWKNGSTISFGYCDNDGDAARYQGAEYDVIFVDEATQLKEEWLKCLTACLRGVNGFPKRMYYLMNPGGESHGYLKRLFIDRKFREGEDAREYAFIPALVTDNQALMRAQPDYVKQLEALPNKLRRAWRYGEWDVYEGRFFDEFVDDPRHYGDRRHTHVIDPFVPPRGWHIVRSYDWGYAKPFCISWYAIDYDGMAYNILEWYGAGAEADQGARLIDDEVFGQVASLERNHPWLCGRAISGVADPSIWAKDGSGISSADTAMKHGVYFTPADNERLPGWMQCRYRLQFDENGCPRIQFFKGCAHVIRTLPLLLHDKKRLEDLDSAQEDHAADALRYFCMSRPIRPMLPKPEATPPGDPLNMLAQAPQYRRR